jgi:hypothetical protein
MPSEKDCMERSSNQTTPGVCAVAKNGSIQAHPRNRDLKVLVITYSIIGFMK